MKKSKVRTNRGGGSYPSLSTSKKSAINKDRLQTIRGEDGPLFFFKPNEPFGEFCQWYPATFTVSKAEMSALVGHNIDEGDPEGWNPIYFHCAEQFMMYCKAGRFHDSETQRQIMAVQDPKEQKRLGRLTRGFSHASWDEIKSDVVVAGNWAKFSQNPRLKELLLDTRRRLLAEAASLDRVWGIGYTAQEAVAVHQDKWGENRLGKALMEVRQRLQSEDDASNNGHHTDHGDTRTTIHDDRR